jgi:hypothetical protein
MWKALLNMALSQLNIHDIIDALTKWFDNYSHKTKNKWDDKVADAFLALWTKFHDNVPEHIQVKMENLMMAKRQAR